MCTNITIYLQSCITETAKMCLNDIRKLDTIAKENIVDLEFYGDKVTIYTNRRKVTKVPNFVIGDPEKLCAWIDSKIKTAWP